MSVGDVSGDKELIAKMMCSGDKELCAKMMYKFVQEY